SGMEQIAAATTQIVASAKDAAGSTEKKPAQRAVLNGAKGVLSDTNALVTAARALARTPSEALNKMLLDSASAVAKALQNLNGACDQLKGGTGLIDRFAQETIEEDPLQAMAEQELSNAVDTIQKSLHTLSGTSNNKGSFFESGDLPPEAKAISGA